MRDYGKIHSSFWTSQTTRGMSEDGRAMALYLLSCPHGTITGVFRLPDGYVCDDLQWTSERVNETLKELLEKGFANRCGTTKWVWIYKHFEWNKPENPNQFKSASKIALSIPDECDWKPDFMRVNALFLGIDFKPLCNPSETLSQPVTATVTETIAVTETVTGAVIGCAEKSAPKKNGTALPIEWALPRAWGQWALENSNMTEQQIRLEAEKFKDHWHANSNQAKAKKADWEATWRNWIRNAKPEKTVTKTQAIRANNDNAISQFLGSEKVINGEVINA